MVMTLAIDPGPVQSAYVLTDGHNRIQRFAKVDNWDVLDEIGCQPSARLVVEMVASYGMPVGEEVFDTVYWIGRFVQEHATHTGQEALRVKRLNVKLYHCHDSKAKDGNIIQALVDRFAKGQPNRGKGTKAEPGWFHGFSGDVWQAYALAVYANDEAV